MLNIAKSSFTGLDLEPVIRLENITVSYRAPEERIGTFKEFAIRSLKRQVRYQQFMALNNVSLELYHGEIFGLVGRNGAGKSTLLKVISRVLIPTQGRVWMRGRVSPLLELGAGFHPELTGRENVFLNGTLLGHSRREIDARMDDILDFAELGNFIDAPIRTYSSGMLARLGFSVATAWEPEILIIDEILAVGDQAFRLKCYDRMQSFKANGTTILIVTHDMNSVRSLCTRAAWLERGVLRAVGPANEVVDGYIAK
jgi:ABC-type polysaccharide/polyol phosphate transport system ATPase subunit